MKYLMKSLAIPVCPFLSLLISAYLFDSQTQLCFKIVILSFSMSICLRDSMEKKNTKRGMKSGSQKKNLKGREKIYIDDKDIKLFVEEEKARERYINTADVIKSS